ncbi:MAG: hypothetical protein RMK91_00765 [Pseudanabaenaceae cyanobacterium SKYGB_i_bin29]|nr:hypothetical protein [Pseudanabaenaceae cyanobacterium SKYG29]MDW8420383.1 hypothetical protein [Pseudanabaenaceae cyanobacterium SKYGB_i_bin29]
MSWAVFSLGLGLGLGVGLLFSRRYSSSSVSARLSPFLEERVAFVVENKLEEFYSRIADALRQELYVNRISPAEQQRSRGENFEYLSMGSASSGEESTEQIAINDTTRLEGFLGRRNIAIKHIPPINHITTDKDIVLDDIAIFMGDRYPAIQKLYDRIKSSMNLGHSVSLCLKDEPQSHISAMCQMSQSLHEIAFLEEYRYQKSPKYILSVKPSRIPEALNFFAGKWLERYMKAKFIRLVKDQLGTERYSFLMNPQIILPNGDDFELDLLLEIDQKVYWFEGKTGNYQKHIDKYARMLPILGLDTDHAFMLLPDVNTDTARTLKDIFHLTVLNLNDFQDTLTRIVTIHSPHQLSSTETGDDSSI